MKWPCLAWILLLSCVSTAVSGMTTERRIELREEARGMFKHGYLSYLQNAYPADELRPLTCSPLPRDTNPSNFGINDVHPNASMTLLDVLSSLPLMLPSEFPNALRLICTDISFDQDVKVQVFEMTIRGLGSLLSTYQFLDGLPDGLEGQSDALGGVNVGVDWKGYRGRLLELALDLGKRLLPAFGTVTGIPYARVNLRYGVEKGESTETCTAGAGSLILEFAVLSRLTGDKRFEELARAAYLGLWKRRSQHGLMANTLGIIHGHWLVPGMSGVGTGMDSYFEYGIKAAVLLDDDTYLDIFHDSYAAVQTHVRTTDCFIYRPVQFRTLNTANPSTIDSLSAFLPGMQVLAGDLESAIKAHLVFWNLWRRYDAMPESWDWVTREVEWAGWPGRPEFIESTYYLYLATKDDFYLRVGERFMSDMKRRIMTKCGFATMKNVETGDLEDRMESFVLSETLKYLYLLFNPTITPLKANTVFTTEGHSLSLPYSQPDKRKPDPDPRHSSSHTCPAYKPPNLGGLVVGIERRADYEYARSLVFGKGVDGRVVEDKERVQWYEGGFCTIPNVPRFSIEIVLTPINVTNPLDFPPEDTKPSISKVWQDAETSTWTISDVTGLRLGARWRFDGNGYDIVSIGHHRVKVGEDVVVTDRKMEGYLPIPTMRDSKDSGYGVAEVLLRFSRMGEGGEVVLHGLGATATFGRDLGRDVKDGWGIGGGVYPLQRVMGTGEGCEDMAYEGFRPGSIALVERGSCTFILKLWRAKQAGASGVLVLGRTPGAAGAGDQRVFEDVGLIRPAADGEGLAALQEVQGVGMVYVDHAVADVVRGLLEGGDIGVGVSRLDGKGDDGVSDGRSGPVSDGRQGRGIREGKLGLGEWEISNLRIVERIP